MQKIYIKIFPYAFSFVLFLFTYLSIEVSLRGYLYYLQCQEPQVTENIPIQPEEKIKPSIPVPSVEEKMSGWHSIRYGVGENLKPFVITRYEGKMVSRSDLEKTIKAVFQRLPNMKTNSHSVALIVETAEAETLRGVISKNTVSSATGLFQILPSTAKDTLSWLKANHKDVYEPLMKMYDRKLSLKDNLYHNVPFSIGLSATYYWRMSPYLWKRIDTHEKRAKLWSDIYNTPLDPQGTPEFYKKQVKKVKNKNV